MRIKHIVIFKNTLSLVLKKWDRLYEIFDNDHADVPDT